MPRLIENRINKLLFKGKAVILYGARQVGKTTLLRRLQENRAEKSIYLNCDEPDIRHSLTNVSSTEIKALLGSAKLVFLDEAQRIPNAGLTLKLAVDNFPDIQIIATGSSSFELSDNISEPLTGRKFELQLFPFSMQELRHEYSDLEIQRLLEHRMVYGMYPEIVRNSGEELDLLKEIARSYLYKDVLQYQQIKNPEILEKLLQALALQVSSEVSFNELAALLGIDKKTVANYIRILEQAFIIFPLRPFSRNLRNELKKLRKIYFVDTGIRNALINNFNPLSLRQDAGALWENFMISERLKKNSNENRSVAIYFWRTHQQQEIDLIEDSGGKLSGFEFKWGRKKSRIPQLFLKTYEGSSVTPVTPDNFPEFAF
ncbi:MAG TPA: ATP-binding protein [Desulfobacteraceae bacterium]|nr:ATP-binding protein [Desulfobacteraceae bacterium]